MMYLNVEYNSRLVMMERFHLTAEEVDKVPFKISGCTVEQPDVCILDAIDTPVKVRSASVYKFTLEHNDCSVTEETEEKLNSIMAEFREVNEVPIEKLPLYINSIFKNIVRERLDRAH
jgi:hypothetical protein